MFRLCKQCYICYRCYTCNSCNRCNTCNSKLDTLLIIHQSLVNIGTSGTPVLMYHCTNCTTLFFLIPSFYFSKKLNGTLGTYGTQQTQSAKNAKSAIVKICFFLIMAIGGYGGNGANELFVSGIL